MCGNDGEKARMRREAREDATVRSLQIKRRTEEAYFSSCCTRLSVIAGDGPWEEEPASTSRRHRARSGHCVETLQEIRKASRRSGTVSCCEGTDGFSKANELVQNGIMVRGIPWRCLLAVAVLVNASARRIDHLGIVTTHHLVDVTTYRSVRADHRSATFNDMQDTLATPVALTHHIGSVVKLSFYVRRDGREGRANVVKGRQGRVVPADAGGRQDELRIKVWGARCH